MRYDQVRHNFFDKIQKIYITLDYKIIIVSTQITNKLFQRIFQRIYQSELVKYSKRNANCNTYTYSYHVNITNKN